MNRRKFITLSTLFASYPAFSQLNVVQDSLKSDNVPDSSKIIQLNDKFISSNLVTKKQIIIPKSLKSGSKVAIVSPSSVTNQWELSKVSKYFKSLGLEIEYGKILLNQKNKYGYFSAPDDERADEFNSYINRDDIDAIIASRGGYGVMRIIDKIDFNMLSKKPKILLGFSDFTFMLNAVSKLCDLVTYHGPVAISSFSNFSQKYIQQTLFNTDKAFEIQYADLIILKDGIAEGRLVGGNLTMLVATLGTKYEIDTSDAILFIEDTNENAYQIDRMLTQMAIAGKFAKVKGIILGHFSNLQRKTPFYPNYSLTTLQVFEQILLPLNIPIVLNFPIGHIENQVTLPILMNAELNTKTKSIKVFHS
jgi:muramoyltetrapeptide carboxypeptidase